MSRVLPLSRDVWNEIGQGFVLVEARFSILDAQVSRAGWALYDLDRETRRSVRVIAGRGELDVPREIPRVVQTEIASARRATSRGLVRPSPIEAGGFQVLRAEPGSAQFLLDTYGLLTTVLLSNPVQFVLTLHAILGWPARVIVRHWPRGRGEEPVVRRLDEEIQIEDGGLRVGASLPAGSRLRLRYKSPEGHELEFDVETPAEESD